MNLNDNLTRAVLGTISLIALVAIGILAFFLGDKLTTSQMNLLVMIVTILSAKSGAVFSYFFDGSADKQPKPNV